MENLSKEVKDKCSILYKGKTCGEFNVDEKMTFNPYIAKQENWNILQLQNVKSRIKSIFESEFATKEQRGRDW